MFKNSHIPVMRVTEEEEKKCGKLFAEIKAKDFKSTGRYPFIDL